MVFFIFHFLISGNFSTIFKKKNPENGEKNCSTDEKLISNFENSVNSQLEEKGLIMTTNNKKASKYVQLILNC